MLEPQTLEEIDRMYQTIAKAYMNRPASTATADTELKSPDNLKFMITAQDLWEAIQPQVESSDWFPLIVDGNPGSGKTTVGRELAHLAHQAGFALLYSSSFDILDAPLTFAKEAYGHSRLCIVLDDISYAFSAMNAKEAGKIKNFLTVLRHNLESRGIKPQIFFIVIAHFTTAVPPLLKNSNTWIFSAPTTQEYDYMIKVVGRAKKLQQQLQIMFNAVKDIQASVSISRDIQFSAYGNDYSFRWGDKNDPGDGRINLLLKNGEAMMYNSKNVYCEHCIQIGQNINTNVKNYMSAKKPDE